MRHYSACIVVPSEPEALFDYLDDPARLAAHMGKSSWMTGGGHTDVEMDAGAGRTVGSRIRLRGSAFGLPVFLDEVITQREPPVAKRWQTLGKPQLWVIGSYTMGFRLKPAPAGVKLWIYLDYTLPRAHRWLGTLLARPYAAWCVRMMLADARGAFVSALPAQRA